jgi:hypothetical protein
LGWRLVPYILKDNTTLSSSFEWRGNREPCHFTVFLPQIKRRFLIIMERKSRQNILTQGRRPSVVVIESLAQNLAIQEFVEYMELSHAA